MANLVLRDVWKSYGKVQALQGVEFACRDGEFFCLLGPSGAGKTTTLKVIAGVEQPDRGEILLDGQSIVETPPQLRDVALAFESYALYPQLTVFENLAFPLRAPLRARQYTKEEVERRVREVASLLNIGELLDRLPRELSGGQRQRVGLGRVLVRRPKVYLLDEPIAHLDAKLRHRMRGELKKIQAELGITTVYATPDQLEALSMADTIAVINQGRIEQIGPPEEIYGRPGNVFVAQFVGDPPMNILPARVLGDRLVVEAECYFELPISPQDQALLQAKVRNGRVKVGIRPKDIVFTSCEADGLHSVGEVEEVETLGQTTVVTLIVGCLRLKTKVPTLEAPTRGDKVGIVLHTDQLHYFDAETDRRLA
jgi:multiple sugar transport system ATP-binding protein